ncbi:hypothetical protein RUA4292_02201 [Ruegeria atlantica]|uniref:Uncharacterized protein n=1 Tax=Ruegeria atlantica TaxID=81569 RepID=A0A0P1EDV0_9RHOB|nr:hypothetical protein RUA4292_02201 [Ruegeria atlantica]
MRYQAVAIQDILSALTAPCPHLLLLRLQTFATEHFRYTLGANVRVNIVNDSDAGILTYTRKGSGLLCPTQYQISFNDQLSR